MRDVKKGISIDEAQNRLSTFQNDLSTPSPLFGALKLVAGIGHTRKSKYAVALIFSQIEGKTCVDNC